MQKILVAGAGKSSPWLIKYLLKYAKSVDWEITVADGNEAAILERTGNHANARTAVFDITSDSERQKLVQQSDIVVSLMPPHLHILLAKDCLQFKKNLITSSYISPEMKELDEAVRKAGLMFMCEMGLDPGIDHMSGSQIIHSIQRVIGELHSFSSFCGGLIAPESDNNPWHYKFSWNPRNIIDAGKAGAAYLFNGAKYEVPYSDMFVKNDTIMANEVGKLAWYPNRDSLKYLNLYDVPEISTFLRATLRHPDFCLGWGALVKLGLTDNDARPADEVKTYADWIGAITSYKDTSISLREHVAVFTAARPKEKVLKMLDWLGLFSNELLPQRRSSNSEILLQLLEQKWVMQPEDKDMVVMQHEVAYAHRGVPCRVTSSMVVTGENREFTAMAKTVGLPIGILTRLVMTQRIRLVEGVVLPDMASVYRPVLTELAHYDIAFQETLG